MDLTIISIAVALVLVAMAAKYYGLISPVSAGARVVIVISRGDVQMKRGVITPAAREHLQALAQQHAIRRATIGITHTRKVVFSRSIPAELRQPIRNLLLNM